ncbi:hypothetical protein Natpe_1594 [Natrinema pellirubrum DSM 15624]|uniref:Uncharacterized protein n=1 Tax=Natrinema pellirubrum (strain DSM 15624 / CIP 106293 / JCM 10476 / NCIMB 786 / 157) TaxID=797303 RepID=L0JM99_NATP1|nr:hypothetical protein [Natrinema pellirubrum]AGB31491.1 hypothetical protein Natpe_1594 [Natrinema pellirubrum DSM 15624]
MRLTYNVGRTGQINFSTITDISLASRSEIADSPIIFSTILLLLILYFIFGGGGKIKDLKEIIKKNIIAAIVSGLILCLIYGVISLLFNFYISNSLSIIIFLLYISKQRMEGRIHPKSYQISMISSLSLGFIYVWNTQFDVFISTLVVIAGWSLDNEITILSIILTVGTVVFSYLGWREAAIPSKWDIEEGLNNRFKNDNISLNTDGNEFEYEFSYILVEGKKKYLPQGHFSGKATLTFSLPEDLYFDDGQFQKELWPYDWALEALIENNTAIVVVDSINSGHIGFYTTKVSKALLSSTKQQKTIAGGERIICRLKYSRNLSFAR